MSAAHCEAKEDVTKNPVFIFDDGWFEEQGYRCWDVEFRWRAVPDDLKPHAWLTLYVAPEWIYHVKSYSTDKTEPIPPRHDPEYEKKNAALLAALDYCEQHHVPTMLMVRRYAKLREAAPSFETVERLLKRYKCVRALLFAELGGSKFSDVDQEHLRGFVRLAKPQGRRVVWALYLHRGATLWNHLMADPQWLAFLRDNADVIVPTWKTVEPYDNMLNWADCVGLWLSGTVKSWGFQFDGWYWPNQYAVARRSHRAKFWPKIYLGNSPTQASGSTFGPAIMSTPPCLVKDTMILAALSGASFFGTERLVAFCPFDGGGSLRSVREKTARLILQRRLHRTQDQVARLVKVAAVNPATDLEVAAAGYEHSYVSPAVPNRLWKTVFGIADGGLDIIPNEGRHFIVPVVPEQSGWPTAIPKPRFITPAEVKDGSFRTTLDQCYPRRFIASDPNVLVFDAGDTIYITDSREENRTTLEFTLESKVAQDYRCAILAQDGTPCDIEVATEQLPGGWRKKFVLFAGCSALLEVEK
ncbi:MAG: hypothetical protein NT105_07645 [Verrucomicrobia bacterium]|nr:hypothetical protein [Verrucomicrobiota bacterium]